MSEEWKKDLAIQIVSGTISGILSGLIVVLAQKGLERRIKKLEDEEKRKSSQEQYRGLSETLITFKKMHINNSKQYSSSVDWRKITPNGEKKEEYNVAFKVIKKWLNTLLIKISKHDKDSSFIAVCNHQEESKKYKNLSWEKYKEIIGKSKNYFKYFDNLKKDSNSVDRCCNVIFSLEKINSFCSKVVAEIL